MIINRKIEINPGKIYDVKVLEAELVAAKAGGEMLVLKIHVTPGNYIIKEFLTDNTPQWRLDELVAALRLPTVEGAHVDPNVFLGLTGRACLKVEIYNGVKQVKVAKWLPPESPSAASATTETDPAQ